MKTEHAIDWRKTAAEIEADYAAVSQQRDDLLALLKMTADDLAYVAYNMDGSKLRDLPTGLVESTGASETALIAERNCRAAIAAARGAA